MKISVKEREDGKIRKDPHDPWTCRIASVVIPV